MTINNQLAPNEAPYSVCGCDEQHSVDKLGTGITNREWLNSLSDEDFIKWLTMPTEYDVNTNQYKEPHPRLGYLKQCNTNFFSTIQKWLEEERKQ